MIKDVHTGLVFPGDISVDVYRILAGSYDIPYVVLKQAPRVLDIGANVGAFTYWARHKWPECKITAYEPDRDNAVIFKANNPDVELIEKAVYPAQTARLYRSKLNCTTHTLIPQNKEQYMKGTEYEDPVEVGCIPPEELPKCDVLKLDTEGCEKEILDGYPYKPSMILLETHTEEDRRWIESRLAADYMQAQIYMYYPGLAEMKFIRRPDEN